MTLPIKYQRNFRYWLLQQVWPGLLGIVSLALTIFVLFVASLQQRVLGYSLSLLFLLSTLYSVQMQWFMWRTQAWKIELMPGGLRGKPLVGKEAMLAWGEIVEITTLENGPTKFPQVLIRSRFPEKSLRFSFVLPHWRDLVQQIHLHAPHCRIDIQPPPIYGESLHFPD